MPFSFWCMQKKVRSLDGSRCNLMHSLKHLELHSFVTAGVPGPQHHQGVNPLPTRPIASQSLSTPGPLHAAHTQFLLLACLCFLFLPHSPSRTCTCPHSHILMSLSTQIHLLTHPLSCSPVPTHAEAGHQPMHTLAAGCNCGCLYCGGYIQLCCHLLT